MYKTVKFLFFVMALIFLTACSTTDLSYKNSTLALQVDGKHLQVNGTPLGRHQENFSNLYLAYEVLKLDAGNIIVYEKARTDSSYEFNFTTRRTIQIVFDAIDMREIYFSSSFYILQLTLQDGRTLNTVVEQLEDQSLNLAYGMSNKQVKDLLNQLNAKAFRPLKQNVISIRNSKRAILSRWTTKKVHFIPLIVPLRVFGLQ
jgi:hypothetical protein